MRFIFTVCLLLFFVSKVLASNVFANNLMIPIKLPQNAFNFMPSAYPVDESMLSYINRSKLYQSFEQHYYFVWHKKAVQTLYCINAEVSVNQLCQNVLGIEQDALEYYQKTQGYSAHYLPYDSNWLALVKENMALQTLPNVSCNANGGCMGIMTHNAQMHVFPTQEPFYHDPSQPGDGYPFDYNMIADIWLGAPVQIVQKSQDGRWYLIKSQATLGWVPVNSVAKTTPTFRRLWERMPKVTLAQRKWVAASGLTLYQGSILLVAGRHAVFVPINQKGYATLKRVVLAQNALMNWPISPTPRHFSVMINRMLNMPYGWGGKDFNSDCSSLMQRFYAAFGIWLPRSSTAQTNFGGVMYSLSPSQRTSWLLQDAGPNNLLPYLTLVSFGKSAGSTTHIGMYLGHYTYQGQPYALIFHTPWGLRISNSDDPSGSVGRVVIGKSLISSIKLGADILPFLNKNGYSMTTLWNTPVFNVILLNQASLSKRFLMNSRGLFMPAS